MVVQYKNKQFAAGYLRLCTDCGRAENQLKAPAFDVTSWKLEQTTSIT